MASDEAGAFSSTIAPSFSPTIELMTSRLNLAVLLCVIESDVVLASGPHVSLTLTTDHVYNGYSKSQGDPAALVNLDYGFASGAYLGSWVGTVRYGDREFGRGRANVEVAPYVGWALGVGAGWTADLRATRYLFDGKVFGNSGDYDEFQASLSLRDLLTARFAYSYDAYARRANTFVYELTGRYSVADQLQLSMGLGFNQARELLYYDFFFWNIGATWFFNRHLALDLRYIDTTLDMHKNDGYHDHFYLSPRAHPVVFSITVGF